MTTRGKQTQQSAEPEPASNAWIPKNAGDTLTGTVIDVDTAWSDYRNASYPLLTIKNEQGEHTVHCFHTVLFNEAMKWEPTVGEEVVITYGGVGKAKTGLNGPHLYKIRVPGRASANARSLYGRLRGQAPPEAESSPNGPEPDGDDDIPF